MCICISSDACADLYWYLVVFFDVCVHLYAYFVSFFHLILIRFYSYSFYSAACAHLYWYVVLFFSYSDARAHLY